MEEKLEEKNNVEIPYFKRLFLLCVLFFKLGIVNFGGGYALLPLLSRELVDKRHWTTDTELADYYAVGQCTPGAIAVNVSTFIGYKICGILGGILATISFVFPAFVIIFIIATVLTNFSDNPFVVNALAGINAVVFILILSAIFKLSKKSIVDIWGILLAASVTILSIFVKAIPLYVYIIVAAVLGLLINLIKEKRFNAKYKVKKTEETEKLEIKEETTEEVKEEKIEKEKGLTKNDVLMFFLGLLVGVSTGLIGCISLIFVKNKKYRNGLISSSFFWIIITVCLIVSLATNNYVYFDIYFNFFRIGACAFGGGLATFPFLQELGQTTGWFNQEQLTAMLAVSESTPGAMGINMSTYVGYTVSLSAYNNNYFLAFLGSIISTLGLVSPSIIVILIVSLFLQKFSKNKYVSWIFYGLRAASIGLICAAAYSVLKVSIFGVVDPTALVKDHYDIISAFTATIDYYKVNSGANFFSCIYRYITYLLDFKALVVALVFGILVFKLKKHPVFYIALGAVVGILLQMGNVSL
ncbi:MAG: chromate transporter [Acholeplasmatales bacterium]|nr:chromate transporter [Acholeplasmatales bacterium]